MAAEHPLRDGLDYLKSRAIEAHLAGDGSQVTFLATLALREAKRAEIPWLYESCRWAFQLGLYWMSSDDFLHVASDALGSTSGGPPETDGLALARFLCRSIERPVIERETLECPLLSDAWLAEAEEDVADCAAVCQAIELTWYAQPLGNDWRNLADRTVGLAGEGSSLRTSVSALTARLDVQQRICITGSEVSDSDLRSATHSMKQLQVASGWRLFFEEQNDELHQHLQYAASTVATTDPEYGPLFYLAHFSRIDRGSREDQFIGLERVRSATRHQPLAIVAADRQSQFSQRHASLARSGYADQSSSDRWACLSLAMLRCISGLRNWHLGEWVSARRDAAGAYLELASRGFPYLAMQGVLGLVESLHVPDHGKQPHVDMAIGLLDGLEQQDRLDLVDRLVQVPRKSEPAASKLLAQLSDSIPKESLSKVASWCSKVEIRRERDEFWKTHLAWWGKTLYAIDNPEEIIDVLHSSLARQVKSQFLWQELETTLTAAMIKGRHEVAAELANGLMIAEIDSAKVDFNGSRESILVHVAKHQPRLRDQCVEWLRARLSPSRQDFAGRWLWHCLNHLDDDWSLPFDDSSMRSMLITDVTDACDKVLSESGGSWGLHAYSYYSCAKNCAWPSAVPELVEKLVEVIDASHVPFVNKGDFLACLGCLVSYQVPDQTAKIASATLRWLRDGIDGRDEGFGNSGGPLSNFHVNGLGPETMYPWQWRLLLRLSAEADEEAIAELSKVAIERCPHVPQGVRATAFGVALTLSVRLASAEDGRSLGLTSVAEATAIQCDNQEQASLPHFYHEAILSKYVSDHMVSLRALWNESEAGMLTDALWSARLGKLARVADPSIRRNVASLISIWAVSERPLPPSLEATLKALATDCRASVRRSVETSLDSV